MLVAGDMLVGVLAVPLGFGLLACRADKSGLEFRGTGGGSDVSITFAAGCVGTSPSLFSPNDKAERLTFSKSAAEAIGGILRSFSDGRVAD